MICKAGGVTKRDVGSIKILDTETRFEIAADKAAEFARLIAQNGSGERGVTMKPADDAPAPAPQRKYQNDGPRPPRDESLRPLPKREERPARPAHELGKPMREEGPRYKVRSDKGEKLDVRPAREPTPPVESKPKPPRVNPKDKGKPKYKNKSKPLADAGATQRTKKKQSYDPLAS